MIGIGWKVVVLFVERVIQCRLLIIACLRVSVQAVHYITFDILGLVMKEAVYVEAIGEWP